METSNRKQEALLLLEWSLILLVAVSMAAYGGAKVVQFDGAAQFADKRVSELTSMQLMWAFYGHSKPFALLIGALEVGGAGLLLLRRTRLLGCLLLTVVLSNIILQDIAFDVNRGALAAAVTYQIAVLGIMWLHRQALLDALGKLLLPAGYSPTLPKRALIVALGLLLAFGWKMAERGLGSLFVAWGF
jgi:hypothetical protein